jgi:DNA-binding IclR family transcriptional regulator
VTSFAAPVFDYSCNMVLGVTLMGLSGVFDPAWDGPQAQAVRACFEEISKRLGNAPDQARAWNAVKKIPLK